MGNFNQQTGDSREAKLLCEIGKSIDKLTKVLSVTVTYTTTATP
jgi:hypothetical protein